MLRAVARQFLNSPGSSGRYAPYILAQSAVPVSCPADTTEDVLATITVPANAIGPNGTLRIWTSWTVTNGGDNKICRVRFSGAAGTVYAQQTLTTTATLSLITQISNVNTSNSQKGATSNSSFGTGTSANAVVTSSVDTTAATTIVITGQKATAGDTLTLERYLVEVLYGA